MYDIWNEVHKVDNIFLMAWFYINPLLSGVPLLCQLKISEKRRFSYFFMEYKR